MRLASLFSGGKDSCLATLLAKMKGFEIGCLVTAEGGEESYMFHYPNVWLTSLASEAMRVPLVRFQSMHGSGHDEMEKEVEDLKKALGKLEIEGVVCGAIASEYQKSRVERICKELGLKLVAPLWHREPEEILNTLLEEKFETIITAVAAEGLDESWLGRKIDRECIEDLKRLNRKHRVHIAGEGGEFETLVLDCPLFPERKIEVKQAERLWKGNSGIYLIKSAGLVPKPPEQENV